MAAATTQVQIGTGASVTWANAETGLKWNREDTLAGTTAIPIPNAVGTNYSWIKNTALAVTVAGTTSISNRRVQLATAAPTGATFWWKAVAVASYAQAASGNMPASAGTNGATPAGYTANTTTASVYDAASVSTAATGPNGQMCVMVCGLDFTYAAGAGNNNAAPSLTYTYDEA